MSTHSIELLLMTTSNRKDIKDFITEKFVAFKEKEGVDVNYNIVSWNRAYKVIIKAFKQGNAPDVLQLGTSWISSLAHLDYISSMPKDIVKSHPIVEWFDKVSFFQGERVGVPWLLDVIILAARKDILDKKNIVVDKITDWNGFLEVCQYLEENKTDNDDYIRPMSFGIRPFNSTVHQIFSWYYANGHQFPELSLESDSFLANDDFKELFQFKQRLIKVSKLSRKELNLHSYQLNDGFYNRNTDVFYMGNWYGVINNIMTSRVNKDDVKFIPLPVPSLYSQSGTYGGGSVLAVSEMSRVKDKAFRLVEYMSSSDFLEDWCKYFAAVPPYEYGIWKERNKNKYINEIYKTVLDSKNFPIHPCWSSMEKILRMGLSDALWKLFQTNKVKVYYSALEDIDSQIKTILALKW